MYNTLCTTRSSDGLEQMIYNRQVGSSILPGSTYRIVVELADREDLKSSVRKNVRVRVPPILFWSCA